MPEQCHTDPPGLWVAAILGSIVIHLLAFGMLRLLLLGNGSGARSSKQPISVQVIAVAPKATSLVQPARSPSSATTRNPGSANTPKTTSGQSLNRQASSASTPPSNRAKSQQTSTQKPSSNPSQNQSPGKSAQKPSPASKPSPNQSSGKSGNKQQPAANSSANKPPATNSSANKPPTTNSSANKPPTTNSSANKPPTTNSSANKLPATNSSANKPPAPNTPSPKPTPPSNNGTQPGGSGTSASPSPVPSGGSSAGPNSPTPEQGGDFVAIIGQPQLVSNTSDVLHLDKGDKLAKLKEGNRQLPKDYLTQVGISLNQVLELKVVVIVMSNGEATVVKLPPQALPGNISPKTAEQLAGKIVEQLRFDPTYMENKPVDRDYNLLITITPSQKSSG